MINLELRQIPFEEELERMNLPTEAGQLVEMMIQERQNILENRYNMVFIYSQLKQQGGEFWADYDCTSLEELLAKFNLPIGQTLGSFEMLVNLFDKETILTVGNKLLATMVSMVKDVQPDSDSRKIDYAGIFQEYCAKHVVFNKNEFIRTVYSYINTHYPSKRKQINKKPRSRSGGKDVLQKALTHIELLEAMVKHLGGTVPRRPIELQGAKY